MKDSVKVWDPLVRIFHWVLVISFATAWISADDWESVHIWAGYTIAALISFRIVWGIIGTRHARFTDFVYRPETVKDYLKGLISLQPKHYLGHNPAGGVMVILLLVSLAVLTFTGMATIAATGEGPLSGTWIAAMSGDWTEDVHELFADFVLLLVFFHVLGVLVSSLLHGENLVRSMMTGRKTIEQKELRHES